MTEQTAPEAALQTLTSRRTARLADIPAIYRTNHERMACELALKLEPHEVIFARYGYDADGALALLDTASFTQLLERIGKEVRESGLSFRSKARAIAEDLLPEAFDMATDPLVSSAVRADIIKWSARVAGLEPKEDKDGIRAGGMTLNITFAGQAPQQVVAHEPVTIEG